MARWTESLHPRDWRGRFAGKGGAARAYGKGIAKGAGKGALGGAALGFVGGGVGVGIPKHRDYKKTNNAFEDIIAGSYKYPRSLPKQSRNARAAIATANFAIGAERGVVPGAVVGGAVGGYKGYKKVKASRSARR
jgi:hypothetical protein